MVAHAIAAHPHPAQAPHATHPMPSAAMRGARPLSHQGASSTPTACHMATAAHLLLLLLLLLASCLGLGPVVALPWSNGGWRAQQQGSSYRGGLDPHLRTTTRKAHQSGRQGDTPDRERHSHQQRQRSNFSTVIQYSDSAVPVPAARATCTHCMHWLVHMRLDSPQMIVCPAFSATGYISGRSTLSSSQWLARSPSLPLCLPRSSPRCQSNSFRQRADTTGSIR
jgi:hypothetical protein